MKKKLVALMLAGAMLVMSFSGCGKNESPSSSDSAPAVTENQTSDVAKTDEAAKEDENLSEIEKIIKEAEGMTLEELAKKAIEESNGKTFYGVGNSSRGKTALPLFIEYLQTIDSNYTMEYEWQQPKNNKIF